MGCYREDVLGIGRRWSQTFFSGALQNNTRQEPRLQQGHFKQAKRGKWAVNWLSTQKRVSEKWGKLHSWRHPTLLWASLWAVLCCQVHLDHKLSKGPLPLKSCCEYILLKLWGFCFYCLAETLPSKIPSSVLKEGHALVTLSQFRKGKNP